MTLIVRLNLLLLPAAAAACFILKKTGAFGEAMTIRFSIYLCLILATAVTGFVFYRRCSAVYRLLSWLAAITFTSELVSRICIDRLSYANPPYHFFIPVAMVFHTAMYGRLLQVKGWRKYALAFVCSAGVVFSVVSSVQAGSLVGFPSSSIAVLNLMVISFSLLLFYHMLQYPYKDSLLKQPDFVLNTANLFFYGITFFILSMLKMFIAVGASLSEWFYTLMYVANLVLYGSYLAAMIMHVKRLS